MKSLKFIKKTFPALLLLVFGSANANAQTIEEKFEKVMADFEVVGSEVAVVKGDEIIYTHAFGWKDRENKVPLSNKDIYRIASISKSFSATVIMQLIEAGKVSLDDDVSDLIGFKVRNPKFPDKVITLRMILSHTSSINDSQRYNSLDIINPEKNKTWQKSYSDYAPGTNYRYCNLNFNMLGAIIERITGERFDLYVKKHVLDPLGLYGGYCVDDMDASRFAMIYANNPETGDITLSKAAYRPLGKKLDSYRIGYDAPMLSPTGNMKINATDLAKYMIMHKNKGIYNGVRIISEESAEQMQSPDVVADVHDNYYGFAIRISDTLIPGVRMTGHTGSAYGLFSIMMFNAEKDFGIVILSSGSKRGAIDGFKGFLKPATNVLYDHFIK